MECSEVLYCEWAYIIAFSMISTVQGLLSHSIFVVVLFWMSGLVWELFGSVYFWSTLLAFTMDALYLMVASIAKDSTSAIILSAPFLMLFLLFNGFTATRTTVSPYIAWAIDISPVAYTIEAITIAAQQAYQDNENLANGYEYVVEMSGFVDQPKTALFVSVVCLFVFRVVQVACFKLLNNIRR